MVNDTINLNKQEHYSGDKKGGREDLRPLFVELFWFIFAALLHPA